MRLRNCVLVALLAMSACATQNAGGAGSLPVAQPLPAACQPTNRAPFQLPSDKGLNYGSPGTVTGSFLGTNWLRQSIYEGWPPAKPRFQADLDFIQSHNLGSVLRLFVGLDQLMVWDKTKGFVRYDDQELDNFSEALDMVDAHHMRVFVVVFDQEVVSSHGNFHFEALDGSHRAMRAGYLRALDIFLHRFGARKTVIGWDLFNEPYNSLGRDGGLNRPPGPDPVSPNYSDATVRSWMLDEYRTARCAAPNAWFTFSDTTALYWQTPPDTALYAGAVDYYDIHIYDNNPKPRDWQATLGGKPYILGEVGADVGSGLANESLNSHAVAFWLSQSHALGARAVLAQVGGAGVYSLKGGLMATGQVVAAAP